MFILKRGGREGEPVTTVASIKINHPADLIKEVLLHTDSEELISQFEQKGLLLTESD